jgi:hypothetical protein
MRIIALVIAIFIAFGPCTAEAEWDGVDKTVVEKYAREAGRPPHEPFINSNQGDLMLFAFLMAGAVGGFAGGYFYRELFPPRRGKEPEDV